MTRLHHALCHIQLLDAPVPEAHVKGQLRERVCLAGKQGVRPGLAGAAGVHLVDIAARCTEIDVDTVTDGVPRRSNR